MADKGGIPLVKEDENQGPPLRKGQAAAIAVGANADYLKAHPDVAKNVAAAIAEGDAFNRDYAKNKNRLIDIAAKYTGIADKALLATAIESQSRLAYPGVSCSAFEKAATGLKTVNGIPKVPTCAEMVAQDVAPTGPLMPVQ